MNPTRAVPIVAALLSLVVIDARLESQTPKDPTRVIRIERVRTVEPNSAGGVEVRFAWRNLSTTKTVKYAWFDVVPYNAVNDRVASEIGRKVLATLESVGPVAPGHWSGSLAPEGNATETSDPSDDDGWPNVWYNSEIVRVEIRRVRIQYMDGSRLSIERSGVKKTLHCLNPDDSTSLWFNKGYCDLADK
jgi:hypothetical protein